MTHCNLYGRLAAPFGRRQEVAGLRRGRQRASERVAEPRTNNAICVLAAAFGRAGAVGQQCSAGCSPSSCFAHHFVRSPPPPFGLGATIGGRRPGWAGPRAPGEAGRPQPGQATPPRKSIAFRREFWFPPRSLAR